MLPSKRFVEYKLILNAFQDLRRDSFAAPEVAILHRRSRHKGLYIERFPSRKGPNYVIYFVITYRSGFIKLFLSLKSLLIPYYYFIGGYLPVSSISHLNKLVFPVWLCLVHIFKLFPAFLGHKLINMCLSTFRDSLFPKISRIIPCYP